MSVAKGQVQPDGSYKYTCGKCKGHGYIMNELCDYCFDGNYELITMWLRTSRGDKYYSLLKAALKISGKAIHDKATEFRANYGTFNMAMAGYLSYHFQINLKALCEWLEETHFLPAGATQRLYERRYEWNGQRVKFQVGHALFLGHQWYEETFGEKSDTWNYLA